MMTQEATTKPEKMVQVRVPIYFVAEEPKDRLDDVDVSEFFCSYVDFDFEEEDAEDELTELRKQFTVAVQTYLSKLDLGEDDSYDLVNDFLQVVNYALDVGFHAGGMLHNSDYRRNHLAEKAKRA